MSTVGETLYIGEALSQSKFWADPVIHLIGEQQETHLTDPTDMIARVTGGQLRAVNTNASLSITTKADRVYVLFQSNWAIIIAGTSAISIVRAAIPYLNGWHYIRPYCVEQFQNKPRRP